MKAIVINGYGGIEKLELADIHTPSTGVGETLVRVRATAVNPADLKWRAGMFADHRPLEFPHVLGNDVAGEVVEGQDFPIGSRVAAKLFRGGYAEYAVVPSDLIALIPDGLDLNCAAAVATGGLTGFQMVEQAVDIRPDERVLVTGALGAVGRAVLYAAKRRGAYVVAAVRAAQRAQALALGADEAVALDDAVPTGGPFDDVIDTVGGADVARLCRHLKPGGRIVTASTTPIEGEDMPVPVEFFAVRPSGVDLRGVLEAAATGKFDVPIAHILPLAEAARAHELLERGGLGGKIVLLP